MQSLVSVWEPQTCKFCLLAIPQILFNFVSYTLFHCKLDVLIKPEWSCLFSLVLWVQWIHSPLKAFFCSQKIKLFDVSFSLSGQACQPPVLPLDVGRLQASVHLCILSSSSVHFPLSGATHSRNSVQHLDARIPTSVAPFRFSPKLWAWKTYFLTSAFSHLLQTLSSESMLSSSSLPSETIRNLARGPWLWQKSFHRSHSFSAKA